jgi:hypothetical protein
MPAPDEALLEVAKILDKSGDKKSLAGKAKKNDRAKADKNKQRGHRGHARGRANE